VELGDNGFRFLRDRIIEVDGAGGGDAFADAVELRQNLVEAHALREELAAAKIAALFARRGEE